MANKAISELPEALNVNNQDLFVLEQGGLAKKLPAETFITEQGIISALAAALDGHGGIQSVALSSVSGRIRTYLITFTDQSATTFQVYDGTSIDRIVKTSTAGLTDTYTVFMNDGTTTFFTVTNGADGTVSEAMLNDALKDKAPAITETTESSAIANFTDGADDMVMHNVVAEINPVQSGSGDPSLSNIRPISGWTGCNVTRTGGNVISSEFELGSLSNTTGLPPSVVISTYKRSVDYISIKPNTKYYLKASAGVFIKCYDSNYNAVYTNWDVNNAYNVEFTTRSNATYMKIVIPASMSESDISINYPSTDTSYHAYIGETLTVDWTSEAGTVYGGTIDVATGLLTVTHAMKLMTGASSEAWNLWDGKFVATISEIARSNSTSSNNRIIIADRFKSNGVQYRAGCGDGQIVKVVSTNNYIACYSSVYADINAFTASLGTNPMTVVYKLATPQTYQLTGQQLMTLLGTNNVWADTGNVSVTYPADTKMYIQNLTQPTEDDMTANQAITSGKFFMVGNNLYLATAAIASGAKIIEGTNATRLSLADALNRL